MTSPAWTVDDLLARVKRKCLVPSTNAKMTDAETVEIIDEELQSRLYPMALMPRDDALTDMYYAQVPAPNVSAPVNYIDLDGTCAGRNIVAIFAYADQTTNPALYRLSRVDITALTGRVNVTGNTPGRYALMGLRLFVDPVPSTGANLLVMFEARPNRLCLTTSANVALVTAASYNATTHVVTYTVTAPGGYTVVNGSRADAMRGVPGLGRRGFSMLVTGVAGPVYTLSASIPTIAPDMSGAAAGDWLCASGWTPVFPLLDVWYPAAVYFGAAALMREMGDMGQAEANAAEAEKRAEAIVTLTSNRVRKDAPPVLSRTSPLRLGGAGFGGWGRWQGS